MTDTNKIEDDGPVFSGEDAFSFYGGMSLRDRFAGQALAGIMAGLCSDHSRDDGRRPRAFNRVGFDYAAADAYHAVDAMLAALSTRKGSAGGGSATITNGGDHG